MDRNYVAPDISGGIFTGSVPAYYVIGEYSKGKVIFHYPKGERDMSLSVSLIYENSIYSIADKRTSIMDEFGNIIKQMDIYEKIVPSLTGRFLVVSVGGNTFGKEDKTLREILEQIEKTEWGNPNISLRVITQCIAEQLYQIINDDYNSLGRKSDGLKTIFSSTFIILGFENNIPKIYSFEIVPDEKMQGISELNEGNSSVFKDFCIVGNIEARIPVFLQLGGKVFTSEEDVVSTLQQYISMGSSRSNTVSSNYDLYKISCIDGRETIEQLS